MTSRKPLFKVIGCNNVGLIRKMKRHIFSGDIECLGYITAKTLRDFVR